MEIYATKGTAQASGFDDHLLYKAIEYGKSYEAGEFTFMPFETVHDAQEPCGYLINYKPDNSYIVYATDTKAINYLFPQANHWIVECNFSVETINTDILHPVLVKRIVNNHLSLERLIKYFKRNDLAKTRGIYLCHLSENNASAKQMVETIEKTTRKKTVALRQGMVEGLNLTPF